MFLMLNPEPLFFLSLKYLKDKSDLISAPVSSSSILSPSNPSIEAEKQK